MKVSDLTKRTEPKTIVTDVDALHSRCDEVNVLKTSSELQTIVKELKATIRANNLNALSANQIGYDKRVLCIKFQKDTEIRSFINPIISKRSGIQICKETCASIPDKKFLMIRNSDIEVTYQDPLNRIEKKRFLGVAAGLMIHHIDHLDGLLLSDIGLEIDEDFENATDEEKEQIIDMYLDSLDLKKKQIDKEVEEDKELNDSMKAIEFIEKVQNGEVTFGDTVTVSKEKGEE